MMKITSEISELCRIGIRKPWRKLIFDAMSAFVVFVGLTALYGFLRGSDFLATSWIGPRHVGMSFQTAICFVLVGTVQLFKKESSSK